ncbi:MAG: NAD(P)/FAD-dependent oxidoreductase [Acidiferrobacteraceae bacterium]
MADKVRSKAPTVIVIGAGFGGLNAVRCLCGQGFNVVLVDRHNYHLFQPLLYQVATGALDAQAVAAPIRHLLRRWRNVRFVLGQVESVDCTARAVKIGDETIAYDYLVVAAGSATNFFGIASVMDHAHDLKGLCEADGLRSHILRMVEMATQVSDTGQRNKLLSFVVVGGGATGVEFAGALAELLHRILPKDFPDLALHRAQVSIIQAGEHLLPSFPRALQEYARQHLETLGVTVRLNTRVRDYTGDQVVFQDGSGAHASTLIWAAGVQAESLARSLAGDKERGGRVTVSDDLSLPGYPEVFVIGDLAYGEQDGRPWPQTAPFALQSGRHAACVIRARCAGQRIAPFRFQDQGEMAVLSRFHAVVSLRRPAWKIRGFPAWVSWLFLHLLYLIGFRNRILALFDWGFDYLGNNAAVRLIMDQTPHGDGHGTPRR